MSLDIKQHLFYETSHSPSLIDLVGVEEAQHIVDFCYIGNPYYPTPAMIRDLTERLPLLIKSYPSSNPRRNSEHLAQVLHVDPARLIIGNGATELITTLCEFFISDIGIPIPTFSEYLDKIEPGMVHVYPLDATADYQLDLDHYAAWLLEEGLPAAVLINPANPTGQFFELAAMKRFLERVRKLEMVIVDESFIDFAGEVIPSLLHSVDHFPNLIIVRSMSKHCGVPGLRLGYCYSANEQFLERMRYLLPTWNINTVAEYLLTLLPPTDGEYHVARHRLIDDVQWLYNELRPLDGFHVYPTGANFVLVRVENGMTARELQMLLLQEYRLYVRDCTNKRGMDAYHIRVASQGREKDRRLVDALWELDRRSPSEASS